MKVLYWLLLAWYYFQVTESKNYIKTIIEYNFIVIVLTKCEILYYNLLTKKYKSFLYYIHRFFQCNILFNMKEIM